MLFIRYCKASSYRLNMYLFASQYSLCNNVGFHRTEKIEKCAEKCEKWVGKNIELVSE